MQGSRGGGGAAKRDAPPVDTFLGEVLSDAGAAGGADGQLEALLSQCMHVDQLAPLTTLLKVSPFAPAVAPLAIRLFYQPRERPGPPLGAPVFCFCPSHTSSTPTTQALGPLRVTLGNAVYTALVTRLEKFGDTELAAVVGEKARYEKLRSACDSTRADYLALRKAADQESRVKAAKALDDARKAARQQRALLARAAAAADAARGCLLLDASADVADAYASFLVAAAELAPKFQEAAASLRAQSATARTAGQAVVTAAAASAAAHASAQEAGGSALAAETSGASSESAEAQRASGQNLGRSHDADIRRLLASGPGNVIKAGYLNKQARSMMGGWRRRWFVLDSSGTLTYVNEQQIVSAAVRNTTKMQHQGSEIAQAPAAGAVETAAGGGGSSGFGGKAMAFLQKRTENPAAAASVGGSSLPSASGSASAPSGGSQGDEDDDEVPLANRTVNLQVSTVKLDGDPNDRSRDLRFCFRLVSPGGSMVLQADSAAERESWVATLQGVIAELLTAGASRPPSGGSTHGGTGGTSGIVGGAASMSLAGAATAHEGKAILAPGGGSRGAAASLAAAASSGLSGSAIAARLGVGPGNSLCADCGAADPDWASLNCGVLICQFCAGAHRNLGTHVSKVRSVSLDAASWSTPLVAFFETFGNDLAARAWGCGCVTAPGAAPQERAAAVRAKYESRANVPAARKTQVAAQPGLVDGAAAACDVARMFAILVAGGVPGKEALHGACARGEMAAQVVTLLLLWGADPTGHRASDGATPEQVALQAGCQPSGDLVAILRAAAAKQAA